MNRYKEILAKLDPEKKVLTESVQEELVKLMEEKERTIREQAYEKALTVVNEKLKEMDDDHANKLQEVVTMLKGKHERQLDEMDDDHARKLKMLVDRIDRDHARKARRMVEAIDADHSAKLERIFGAIDEDHARKLKMVIEKLREESVDQKIVEGVSDYLDVYLEKVSPRKRLVNEARLARLEKFYRNVREMAMVNDEYVQTEIREAVEDAAQQLRKKDTEIDRLMVEKVEIAKSMRKLEAGNLLSEKCQSLSPALAAYLQTMFGDATRDEIEERFDEAVVAFKREESAKRAKLVEASSNKAKVKNPVVFNEGADLHEKREDDASPEPNMVDYVSVLSKSFKAKGR